MEKANDILISVCIPVYNRAEIVERTLESVYRQTYRPFRLVLVDNNSTDETLKVLNEWKKEHEDECFQVTVLEEHKPGASAARNRALSDVSTPWVLFFDSDDTMPHDHIEKIVKKIKGNPEADIIGWSKKIHFQDGSLVYKKFNVSNPKYNNLTHSILSTQSYAAKTELFREVGGWDEELSMGDDIELGSRILALDPIIAELENHRVDVYDSKNSITNNSGLKTLIKSLEKIRCTLPSDKKHWVDLQIIIKAASWARNDPDSGLIVKQIMKKTPFFRRQLWKLFYFYQLKGGRGVAKLYSLLHLNRME